MTLKEKLPQWESDYLMPAWLILAILAAAVAETVIVGYGVWKLYDLWLGWPVGFVVASTQALGSQMYSYNATHNSRRYIKWRVRKGERYFNEWEAEPALNVWLPLAVSIGAGVVAGSVGIALYRSIDDTLSVALVALSVASPAGSIAAALLNGLFASGELAIKGWREQAEQEAEQNRKEPSVEPPAPEPKTARTDAEPVRERAFAELNRNPRLSGAALAAQIGVTSGYGRKLKRDWTVLQGNGSGRVPEREEQEA